jgi:hypothetical protein
MPARLTARGTGVLATLVVAALLGGLAVEEAHGERRQQGNLIVSLDGRISPRKLPRHQLAPASVHLSGELRTTDGSTLPRLRKVELEMAGRGALNTRGLPICRRGRLDSISPEDALEACGEALVGRGRVDVEIFLPHQKPFAFHATLRAFNGRLPAGRRAVWLHVYGSDPPSSFVLPFFVHRRPGDFGTALVAVVPPDLGPWPHLARFELTLSRRFSHRGRPRSFLNAECPVPAAFTAGIFPFARATYSFAGDRTISATIVRGCRVRGGS